MALTVSDLKSLEIGQLYYRLCAFDQAIAVLETALQEAREKQEWTEFGRLLSLAMRIWAERLEFDQVDKWLPAMAQVPEEQRPPSITYVLGIVGCYRNNPDEARQHFLTSLTRATELRDECQARFGLANVAIMKKDYTEADQQISAVQSMLESSIYLDLRVAAYIFRAVILRHQGQYGQAIEQLVQSQRLCQRESNLYMALNTLYGMGCAYLEKGDLQKADDYFQLLENLVDPSGLRHLSNQLAERRQELAIRKSGSDQLQLIEHGERSLVLPTGERIDLKKQFVLMNLLKLFGEEPGRSVSKEDIVRKVWKEDYHPLRHDNKIHATILRLRRLMEKDAKNPTYILNTEEGYCLSPRLQFSVSGGPT